MPGPSIPTIDIQKYSYELPPDRIASYPLDERDASKLLRFSAVDSSIEHYHFRDLASLLPEGSGLVMNSTRVIAARLLMSKQTGGRVEVLLVDPTSPSADPVITLQSTDRSVWNCMIGGRNVHEGAVLTHEYCGLTVTVLERNGTSASVELHWEGGQMLGAVLEHIGRLPLPPYIHREVEAVDAERYQTVYAKEEGSVAAPTAGLHFTQRVLDQIESKNISTTLLTLHVGLGTFQPVTVTDARDHTMHAERFGISHEAVEHLARHASSDTPWLTLVGTTSLRTMESLFVVGARIATGVLPETAFVHVDQWAAFDESLSDVSRAQAFTALQEWMQTKQLENLWGQTSIMIAPGCRIASADALITNFHQPGNTLMLLVAAFMGEENWRNVYNSALENDYRFLSYGDSSLLVR
jgi:S-adenosylmethionine:tRNA ribosyltransferase-isomerase